VGGSGPTGGFSPLAITVNGTFAPSVADLDGDHREDILWYAAGSAADFLWMGRSSGPPQSRTIAASGTYTPLLVDLDHDVGADIVWFQSASTTTPVWWGH
jgi:hypothetical protein